MKKIDAYEARQVLLGMGIHWDQDFHTLRSEKVDLLVDAAKARGYRKSKNAPGSTARMFFEYLVRQASKED